MIQGIQGFLDFTSTMFGEDVIGMEKTNNKLRTCLPSNVQDNLDAVNILKTILRN